MKRFLSAVAMPLVLLAGHSVQAKAPPSTDKIAAMSDGELADAFDKARKGDGLAATCDAAPYIDELARRRQSNTLDGFAAFFDGSCALASDKPAEALHDFETAEGVTPVADLREMAPGLDALALYAALRSSDYDAFGEHAGHIARRNSPDEYASLDADMFRFGFNRMKREQTDAVVLSFARSAAFDHLPEEMAQIVEGWAVGAALRAGDVALARQMAPKSASPDSYLDFLIDREYAPIWPQVAQAAGPHLQTIIAQDVAKTTAELAANPADKAKRQAAARARLFASDYAGVVALAAAVDHSRGGLEKIVEDDAWLLNLEVKALDGLGRRADADRIFDDLTALPAGGRGWMVNFVINRADRLVGQGRWAEALPAAELAVKVAATQGSPYAKEVAAVDRYCAAIKADPSRDLSAWWQEIDANWKDNVGSAVQAAQCKGDRDAALRYLRGGLNDEDHRHSVLLLLQPRKADFYRDQGNMFEEPRKYLAEDAELKALFDKYGRDLPAELLPQPAAPAS